MAFLMMPLDHSLPDVLVHLHPSASMKVDSTVEFIRKQLLEQIAAAGFEPVGYAADGDPGTNPWHTALVAAYQHLEADATLDEVIEAPQAQEPVRDHAGWEMAVSDMLPWLKRLRGRLIKCHDKGVDLESRSGSLTPDEVAFRSCAAAHPLPSPVRIAVRACDEKPADFVHAPCDVAHCAAMAIDWMRGVSGDLIVWLRDVCDQLDELDDRQRAQHDRQGAMTGSPHYARCLFRH